MPTEDTIKQPPQTDYPPEVLDHLFSAKLSDFYDKVREKLNLSQETLDRLNDLVLKVYDKKVILPDFIKNLEKELKLDGDRSKKLGIQILGRDFLPIAEFLEVDVASYLRELGADPNTFAERVPPREIAQSLAEKTGLNFEDQKLHERLVNIILNRVNNVRDDLETRSVLTRSLKLGGLEVDEKRADSILKLVKSELETLIKNKITLGEEKEKSKAESTSPVSPLEPISSISPISFKRNEEPKALKAESKLPPPPPRPPSIPIKPVKLISPTSPTRLPNSATPVGPIRPASPIISTKSITQTAVSKITLKPGDILSSEEGKELQELAQRAPRGGESRTQIIKETIERIYAEQNLRFDDPNIRTRFELALSNRLKDIRDTVETRALLERATNLGGLGLNKELVDKILSILDEVFASFTEDMRVSKELSIQRAERQKQEELENVKLEKDKKEHEALEERYKSLTIKSKQKPKKEKKPLSPIHPTDSASPISPTAEKKPSVSLDDIKYTPKLVGPLDELKNFKLEDMRRLSQDPKEATTKILQKLELLQSESAQKGIQGGQALKASPLFKLYAEIITAALMQGKNPQDVVKAKLVADEAALSESEFNAIMELSTRLNY